jgi:hypothetical protein
MFMETKAHVSGIPGIAKIDICVDLVDGQRICVPIYKGTVGYMLVNCIDITNSDLAHRLADFCKKKFCDLGDAKVNKLEQCDDGTFNMNVHLHYKHKEAPGVYIEADADLILDGFNIAQPDPQNVKVCVYFSSLGIKICVTAAEIIAVLIS